jgi:hypothetical protein
MELFVTIWVAITLLIIIGIVFWSGYDRRPSWEKESEMGDLIAFAIGWPIILMLAVGALVIVGPFYGIYRLGEYVRTKRDRQSTSG